MVVLAIDTSESHCSAALMLADGSASHKMEDIGRGHAERLIPMIEELLEEAGLVYGDIERIAVVTGPGTFTGLRIGLSVARGLALTLGVPCIGVMSLMALAAESLSLDPRPSHVLVKGRGGQVFFQSYDQLDDTAIPIAVQDAVNVDLEIAASAMAAMPGTIVGSGIALLDDVPAGCRVAERVAVNPVILARLSAGMEPAKNPPEPTYLRQADAAKAKAVFQVRAT